MSVVVRIPELGIGELGVKELFEDVFEDFRNGDEEGRDDPSDDEIPLDEPPEIEHYCC
ncbi:hypothetical protein [Parvularcula marina]|uniref:hypothetical protein n=1 Tax=Parvularcula marina TaxID=2292771 RepID=UPI0013147DFC|nr:hypothetical protein [Parvularcula marina]